MRVPLLIVLAVATPAAAADLKLTKVMLSTGGVSYSEYAADSEGPTNLGLDVPLEQVDDILKSLVVFDSAGGVGGIELPGLDSTNVAFGDVPFGPEALGSPVDFLNSLQGVDLDVKGPTPMQGRLLRAELVREATRAGAAETFNQRTRVTLLAAEGLRQFILDDADAVQVADPHLRERIARAVDALRRDAGRTTRHLTLRGSGTGKRTVRVGFVAAAPLWKTSYRLILPPPGKTDAKARLQGWAVLENTTGTDWNNIELTLQYGNPVTFHQAIYRSYFVDRPEVPVEILGRLLPTIDTRATTVGVGEVAGKVSQLRSTEASPAALAQSANPVSAARPAMAPIAAPAEQTTTTEGTEDTVFTLPTPIILAAGHSASVPILDRDVTAQRIALAQFNRPHPFAAVKLTNTTATTLPAGALTLYDTAAAAPFAGDARLGPLPAGESRLLSFAEDLRTTLAWRSENAITLAALTGANGILRLDQRQRTTTRIDITAPVNEPRDMLVELPRRPETTLVPDPAFKPAEETATAWRFAVALKAGEHRTLSLQTDRITRQQLSLAADRQIVTFLLGQQGLDDRARTALQRIATLRADETQKIAERDKLRTQRTDAEHTEERIRANIAAVPANDALRTRLIRQLETEETRIATIGTALDLAEAAVTKASETLGGAIASFQL